MSLTRNIVLVTAVVTFLVDQLTKVIVVHWFDLKSTGAIDVLPPLLNFRMAWNRGINFGLFAGDTETTRWILIVLSLVISGWVLWWTRKEGGGLWARISAGLLVGGALGNVIDRLIYGAVADFLNMSCCGIENPFAFNVADIAIFSGAIGLILFTGKAKDRDAPEKSG